MKVIPLLRLDLDNVLTLDAGEQFLGYPPIIA